MLGNFCWVLKIFNSSMKGKIEGKLGRLKGKIGLRERLVGKGAFGVQRPVKKTRS